MIEKEVWNAELPKTTPNNGCDEEVLPILQKTRVNSVAIFFIVISKIFCRKIQNIVFLSENHFLNKIVVNVNIDE
jgi:hypothetical protein